MPRISGKEIGITGLHEWSGNIQEDFLRELRGKKGYKRYNEMRLNSPVIGSMLFAIEQSIRPIKWFYTSVLGEEDPRIEFLEDALKGMTSNWNDHVSEVLTMLPFGFAPFEIVYEREGSKIVWRKFAFRGQDTIIRWLFDDAGGMEGFEQRGMPDYKSRTLPIEKLVLYRTKVEKNNPEGRALDPNTLIPTPDGWRKMDDITVGDKIFDEEGRIRYVVARQDWENRPCYEITFSDSSTIIADENHTWITQKCTDRSKKRPSQERSTKEIFKTQKTSAGVSNHSIEWAKPLDYVKQELPLDPYYLGLWLGDGYARASTIACHVEDVKHIEKEMVRIGYQTEVKTSGPLPGNGRHITVKNGLRKFTDSPQSKLRIMNMLQNKHIPRGYMQGSIHQRRELLAGLMDSDGYIDTVGRCEFTNTNKILVDGVTELVRSLGCSAYTSLRRKADIERNTKQAWCVKFRPTWSPFKLSRKSERIRLDRAREYHYITSVKPVSPRRTVCIETDAPSNLFLAGEGVVPTHNSILRTAWVPYYYAKNIMQIEAMGIERDLAGLPVITLPKGANTDEDDSNSDYSKASKLVRNVRNDEQAGIVLPSPEWKFELASTEGSRNFNTDAVIRRYESRMLMSALAQFLILGQNSVGTQALSSDMTDFWTMSVNAIADVISETHTKFAMVKLLKLNGMDHKGIRMEHSPAGDVDVGAMGVFLQQIGNKITWLVSDEQWLRGLAGLPEADLELIEAERTKIENERQAFMQFSTEMGGSRDLWGTKVEDLPNNPKRKKAENRLESLVKAFMGDQKERIIDEVTK